MPDALKGPVWIDSTYMIKYVFYLVQNDQRRSWHFKFS